MDAARAACLGLERDRSELFSTFASPRRELKESPDRLRGDLSIASQRLSDAVDAREIAEHERLGLIDKVARLEDDLRVVTRDAQQKNRRCLELERERADLAYREDQAQQEVSVTHARERTEVKRLIELELVITEAENREARLKVQIVDQQFEIQRLQEAVNSRSNELGSVRGDLCEVRTESEARRTALETLNIERVALQKDHAIQYETLCNANRRSGMLEARCENLEHALLMAKRKQAEHLAEAEKCREHSEKLDEGNRRLRLDLQNAIGQAVRSGEAPFYAGGCQELARPACLDDCGQPWPWRSPRATASRSAACEMLQPKVPAGLYSTSKDSSDVLTKSPRGASTLRAGGMESLSPLHPLHPARPAASRHDYPKSTRSRRMRMDVVSARGEAMDISDSLASPTEGTY